MTRAALDLAQLESRTKRSPTATPSTAGLSYAWISYHFVWYFTSSVEQVQFRRPVLKVLLEISLLHRSRNVYCSQRESRDREGRDSSRTGRPLYRGVSVRSVPANARLVCGFRRRAPSLSLVLIQLRRQQYRRRCGIFVEKRTRVAQQQSSCWPIDRTEVNWSLTRSR